MNQKVNREPKSHNDARWPVFETKIMKKWGKVRTKTCVAVKEKKLDIQSAS